MCLVQTFQQNDPIFCHILSSAVRVEYSQTIQIKASRDVLLCERLLKLTLLIVSSLTAGGLILTLGGSYENTTLVTVFSIISVVLGSVLNVADLRSLSDSHKNAADELWKIREEYKTLVMDFEEMSTDERIRRRD